MRFKTDENLHPELAEFLQERGHDAVTVWQEELRGRPDAELAEVCRREERALVTLDLDFADIRAYPPDEWTGPQPFDGLRAVSVSNRKQRPYNGA